MWRSVMWRSVKRHAVQGVLGGRTARAALPFLVAALAVVAPPSAAAQQIERERQEGILVTEGVFEISPELRGRLNLFPEIQGFRVARLFLRADGAAILEIEFVQGGVLQRERRLLSPEALRTFRETLEGQLRDPATRFVATREGRVGLVLSHTLLGLGFHGWAIPMALDISSGQAIVGTYLLTAGTSFYLPYRLTQDRSVTDVHRSLSVYGGTRGIVSGLFIGDLLNSESAGSGERNRFGAAVITSAAGGLGGFMAMDRWAPNMGDAQLMQASADAGILSGAAIAYLSGPYKTRTITFQGEGYSWTEERRRNRRAGHAITLAGQGAGLATGIWLANRRDYSDGDVSVLRSFGVLGAQTGSALARVAGGDDGEPIVAGALAGGLLSAVLADQWMGARNLGTGEGLLVNAGHVAGAATALGLTYLFTSDMDDRGALYMSTAAAGGWIGAGLVLRAVSGNSGIGTGMIPGVIPGMGLGGVEIAVAPAQRRSLSLDPMALVLSSVQANAYDPEGGWATTPAPTPLPWLTIRF